MRLLHTSDWHLGRGLHGVDLHEAQRNVVDQVVETVTSQAVDAVLISGDIYDRAVPPVASVRLWSEALNELSALVPVIVIPGNHDSATRLGVGSDLFRDGVHVVTELSASRNSRRAARCSWAGLGLPDSLPRSRHRAACPERRRAAGTVARGGHARGDEPGQA